MDRGGDEDDTQTYVKRIKGISTDLRKISQVNHFSRQFSAAALSVDEGMTVLKEIDDRGIYPLPVRLLGAAMISSAFCLIFGGSAADCCISVFSGILGYLFSVFLNKLKINSFVTGFCSCALVAFIALSTASLIDAATYDPIIIGTIMLFVPGVALTNSIRDFLSGDMLAGVARLMENYSDCSFSGCRSRAFVIKLWENIGRRRYTMITILLQLFMFPAYDMWVLYYI